MPLASAQIFISAVGLQQYLISAELGFNAYRPGDLATGVLAVTDVNGAAVAGNLTFNLTIPFGSSSVALVNQAISATGRQVFSFLVPANTTLTRTTGTIVVSNGTVSQTFGFDLSIIRANTQVVDFYPESGVLIYNVSNKIYFQSWTDSSRSVPADFSGATLVETRLNGTALVTSPVANLSISTVDQGRGFFFYTPSE